MTAVMTFGVTLLLLLAIMAKRGRTVSRARRTLRDAVGKQLNIEGIEIHSWHISTPHRQGGIDQYYLVCAVDEQSRAYPIDGADPAMPLRAPVVVELLAKTSAPR